jgi:hypothetical protein
VHLVLKCVCVAYLLYLAWNIASAAGPGGEARKNGKPLTFLQAAAFQWVNLGPDGRSTERVRYRTDGIGVPCQSLGHTILKRRKAKHERSQQICTLHGLHSGRFIRRKRAPHG